MGMTSQTVRSTELPSISVSLDVPDHWLIQNTSEVHAFVAVLPPDGAGPFADNVTVGIQDVPDGLPVDMEAVRTAVLTQLHTAVPDMHLLDDRPAVVSGTEARFLALLQSDPQGTSVVVRQVFGLFYGALVTVAVTSFPFRDREASEVAEQVMASVTVTETSEDR